MFDKSFAVNAIKNSLQFPQCRIQGTLGPCHCFPDSVTDGLGSTDLQDPTGAVATGRSTGLQEAAAGNSCSPHGKPRPRDDHTRPVQTLSYFHRSQLARHSYSCEKNASCNTCTIASHFMLCVRKSIALCTIFHSVNVMPERREKSRAVLPCCLCGGNCSQKLA